MDWEFNIGYYLNWDQDRSIYGIETSIIQDRYNELYKVARLFKEHVFTVVEINYGYGYMFPLLSFALESVDYVGFDSDAKKQEIVDFSIKSWNSQIVTFDSYDKVVNSRLSLWDGKRLPIGPVDMVIIHGQQHLKLASKIGRWVWILDALDTKGLKVQSEIWSNNG